MRIYSSVFVAMALLCGTMAVSAQGVLIGRQYDSLLFQQRVSSMDEFMERFNGEDLSVQEDGDMLSKMQRVFRVCNRDVLDQDPQKWFPFLTDLAQNGVRLRYTDTNWAAIATCVVDVDGREDTVTLTLKVERVKRSIYKWAISSASGSVLTLSPLKESPLFSISPANNEVNFISLSDITTDNAQNILCYGSRDCRVDQTSVFYALVAKGYLKIKYVVDLVYRFDVAKYTFFVSFFNRDTFNAGWLISDFVENHAADHEK